MSLTYPAHFFHIIFRTHFVPPLEVSYDRVGLVHNANQAVDEVFTFKDPPRKKGEKENEKMRGISNTNIGVKD